MTINVLEISKSSAAGYAGSLLAELGRTGADKDSDKDSDSDIDAEIKVMRLSLEKAGERSPGAETFLHHQKSTLPLPSPRRAAASTIRVENFDVVLEDVGRSGLKSLGWSYRSLRQANKALIVVSLSPFGLRGAYEHWEGNDFLAQAVGGVMHTCGYDDGAPQALPGEAAYMIAGLHGATAALTALFERASLEPEEQAGIHVDISAQDTFMQHWTRHVSEYAYSGVTSGRAPRNPEGLHYRHTAMASDGWIYLLALREPWQDLAAFVGLGEFISADALSDGAGQPPWSDMAEAFTEAVGKKSKYEWFAEAADLGWTFAPVEDPFEIAASPQLAARGGMASGKIAGEERHIEMPPLPWLSED